MISHSPPCHLLNPFGFAFVDSELGTCPGLPYSFLGSHFTIILVSCAFCLPEMPSFLVHWCCILLFLNSIGFITLKHLFSIISLGSWEEGEAEVCAQAAIMNQIFLFYDFEFETEYRCICSPGYIQHFKVNNKVALEVPIKNYPFFILSSPSLNKLLTQYVMKVPILRRKFS